MLKCPKQMDSGNIVSILLFADQPDYVLFKVAIDFAEQGLNVWFISIAPIEKIPEKIQQPSKETLQLITFIYLKGYQDLIKHLNGIYKWQHQPDLIILKNLETYSSELDHGYKSVQAGFVSASLIDSITFLARKKNSITSVLVCSTDLDDQGGLYERLKSLYDMYYDNFLVKNKFNSEENLISKIEELFLLNNTTDGELILKIRDTYKVSTVCQNCCGFLQPTPTRSRQRLGNEEKSETKTVGIKSAKKKQEEKKKQKKEKQSNKAKKEVEKNNSKKSTNVVRKQLKKEQKKQKEKSGFLEQLSFFVLLSISVITGSWYLYNYQYDTVKPLLELFKYYYQIFLDKLPDSGRYYLKSVVESLNFVQQSTRNVTRKYIEVIKDNEMVQGFIFKVKDGISNIVGKFVGDKV